jgi:transcriptional regulator with XRE-family HTH domain
VNETVGEQVKILRREQHLTQAQLAARVGTRQPIIARLEAGQHVPTWRTLERVAKALGASVQVSLTRSTKGQK